MFNPASKIYFALTALVSVFFVVYAAVISTDRLGTALAFALALALFLSGLALTVNVGPELRANGVMVEAADRDVSPRPSVWPFVCAVTLAVAVVAMATNGWLVVAALVVAVIAGAGWQGQAWREDHSWSSRLGERFGERVVRPFLFPAGAALLVALIAISISRVLLAVDRTSAIFVAMGVAFVIMVGLTFVVTASSRVAPNILAALGVGALLAVGSVGTLAAIAGAREPEHEAHHEVESQEVGAFGTAYVSTEEHDRGISELRVNAKAPAEIVFVNYDEAIFHNLGIYARSTQGDIKTLDIAGEKPLWNGKPVEGTARGVRVDYRLPRLPSGSYLFRCDFHPSMVGRLTVE